MSFFKYLNPVFIYGRRHLLRPYLQNYMRDLLAYAGNAATHVRVAMAEHGMAWSESDRRLAALRGIHQGRRAFIIGNGPSLRTEDLERLGGEITIACNRIYSIFERTSWRPTYYATYYVHDLDDYHEEQDPLGGFAKFVPIAASRQKLVRRKNTIYYRNEHRWFFPGQPEFSRNALEKVCWGGSVTYVSLQLACYMGITTVFLLGVDHDYNQNTGDGRASGKGVWTGNFSNYYPGERRVNADLDYYLKLWEAGYRKARESTETIGVKIYNATRGGKLEVFPRVDFDQVVK